MRRRHGFWMLTSALGFTILPPHRPGLLTSLELANIAEAVTEEFMTTALQLSARLRLFASPPADTVQLAIGRDGSFYHRGIIFNRGLGRFSSKTQKPRVSLYVRTHSARDDRKPSTKPMTEQDYDLIGDIHGHADALRRLLIKLGYMAGGGGRRAVLRASICPDVFGLIYLIGMN